MTPADTATAAGQPLLMSFGRGPGPLRTLVLHPAGGGLGPYVGLMSALARRGTVHGIRAAGLLPGEEPDRTVPDMTERYLKLLRDLPEPPNLLIGWSLGGALAWELAAQLAEDGPRPAVAMIDSYAEPWSALDTARPAVREAILGGAMAPLDAAARERAARTTDAHLDACARHHATHQGGSATLLMACSGDERDRQVAAWRRRDPDLVVRDLPGGHFEVFQPAHFRVLLRHLDPFLSTLADTHGEIHDHSTHA